MKQEIIFNDNTLQEQHLYNEVATLIFLKLRCSHLNIKFKVFPRSKGQNLTKIYDFLCKTFRILSIFTSTFILNYHLKIFVFALMCLSKSLLLLFLYCGIFMDQNDTMLHVLKIHIVLTALSNIFR